MSHQTPSVGDRPIPLVHIIRHGESLHNIQRGYPYRDPPLTEAGERATKDIKLTVVPDLVLISPMTRAIQTALNTFPSVLNTTPFKVEVQIWPDLREAHDAECNKGFARPNLEARYPQFDFSDCPEDWNYPLHTVEGATARAEKVRKRLKELSVSYTNIAIITHRGFIAFLVKGRRFNLCESRSYRFATDEETKNENVRIGIHCDSLHEQDFGPTTMVLNGKPWDDLV